MSKHAETRLGFGKGTGKTELVLDGSKFNKEAAEKILEAMVKVDFINKPTPLTAIALKLESTDELINAYFTANALQLDPTFRGDNIRGCMIKAIKSSPLSFAHFKRLTEEAWIDKGLISKVNNHVMHCRVYGDYGARGEDPEYVKIRQYAMHHEAQYGLWSELEAIRTHIKDVQEEKQEKAAEARYEKEFPALPSKK